MKSAVDLTQNLDFSNSQSFRGLIIQSKKKKFPWSVTEDKPLKSNYERVVFPTGYIKDIRWAKQYKNTYINHCDCCGKSLDNKPWSNQYCLCDNCATQVDYLVQKDKIPYKDRESVYNKYILNTSDRVVIEMNYRSF